MDTNVNNYTIDEIFSIMKVNKECKLEELYDATKNIMKKLEDSNKENIYEYKHFFRECFKKIIFKQGLSVPDYIYKSLGIIKLDNKLPEVDSVKNTEGTKIVDPKNYPGAVPEIIPNDMCVNTSITQYPRGLVNPIKRETIKNLLTINSKFRDDVDQLTTDFSVELNDVYQNVVSMKLASLEFMNSYYTFSTYLKTNEFKVTVFEYNTTTNQLKVFSLDVIHITSSFITSSRIHTSGSNIFGDDVVGTETEFCPNTFNSPESCVEPVI